MKTTSKPKKLQARAYDTVWEPYTPARRPHPPAPGANVRLLRRDRLGGLICEYSQVA